MEVAKSILLTLSVLFPIVNPLGGSPVFLALTNKYPVSARGILARRVAMNSFVLLIAFFLIGTHILAFFGISIPVVQVGGGLIVISNGWAMLKRKEDSDRGGDVQKKVNLLDIFKNAFYPLTLPLTVGPGSISVAITLGANEPATLERISWLFWQCDRFSAGRTEHLPLLRLRRSAGGAHWRQRDEHYPAALVLPPSLH